MRHAVPEGPLRCVRAGDNEALFLGGRSDLKMLVRDGELVLDAAQMKYVFKRV
jgi:hypothetical protein